MVREKKIISGRLLEVEYYPVYSNGRKMLTTSKKGKRSRIQQEKYNINRARKQLIRIVNTNFCNKDLWVTVTFDKAHLPQDEKDALRQLKNFFKRLRRYFNKNNISQKLKYVYIMENSIYQTGKYKGLPNIHFHLFIGGFGIDDRDVVESLWDFGTQVNADRFRPEKFGPEAAANYVSKAPRGSKKFVCSKGLKRPIEKKARDGVISHRGIEKLAKLRNDDNRYWENKYKGYKFLQCYARKNPYNSQYYLSIVMYKASEKDKIPKWQIEEDDYVTDYIGESVDFGEE